METENQPNPTATCNQKGCNNPAEFRFTWPGRDEAGICGGHAPKLRAVANAMGLHLQLIPLNPEGHSAGVIETRGGEA